MHGASKSLHAIFLFCHSCLLSSLFVYNISSGMRGKLKTRGRACITDIAMINKFYFIYRAITDYVVDTSKAIKFYSNCVVNLCEENPVEV